MAGIGGDRRVRGAYQRRDTNNAHEVGIFFLHHATDPVTTNHLSLIKRYNPNIPVVTVSGGNQKFPEGLLAKDLSWGGYRWAKETQDGKTRPAWMFSDLMLYGAYAITPIQCKRWVVFEWDVLCTTHVIHTFQKVWNVDLSAEGVFTRRENPKWPWFARHGSHIPAELQQFAAGANPFGVLLCSDRLLKRIQIELAKMPAFAAQNELRIGTLCNAFGMKMETCKKIKGAVSCNERYITLKKQAGIYHPVKRIIN